MTKILKLQKVDGAAKDSGEAVDYSTLSLFRCQNG
ncbi:MAG: hypothetical protein FD126_1990 [Elusimicrobia bacterium]|nr:MAG: hypothetical protein FD126_1990 [Elusimicrobiota bacterium]